MFASVSWFHAIRPFFDSNRGALSINDLSSSVSSMAGDESAEAIVCRIEKIVESIDAPSRPPFGISLFSGTGVFGTAESPSMELGSGAGCPDSLDDGNGSPVDSLPSSIEPLTILNSRTVRRLVSPGSWTKQFVEV